MALLLQHLRHACRALRFQPGFSAVAILTLALGIGLRLAIGASPKSVVWLFVREGMILTAIGLATGLAGALAVERWIRSLCW